MPDGKELNRDGGLRAQTETESAADGGRAGPSNCQDLWIDLGQARTPDGRRDCLLIFFSFEVRAKRRPNEETVAA